MKDIGIAILSALIAIVLIAGAFYAYKLEVKSIIYHTVKPECLR